MAAPSQEGMALPSSVWVGGSPLDDLGFGPQPSEPIHDPFKEEASLVERRSQQELAARFPLDP